ncbi:fimbrial protein [Burkholderia ubonensis]|uniref:fimbrial biogenesis chaperone n=1 Tax=Burkholderia ubonensis TaxID=101571 RepID=UPI0007554DFB|nr:molecular chaperone [Burkholderia ubonensis]KVA76226.1 fimbrial protein [Burkholderia ubonensis]KVC69804.1 fimbrial protein [Burkholderia ubonensis]KVG41632.1 fimbrial protein [Burkholderia ubonensis]KVN36500.1 fimbrial protein [Burkholderia ubonensis]KVO50681.1 fimbrial protein [Burkholderia ubonensis]
MRLSIVCHVAFAALLALSGAAAHAGIQVGGTRVIFDAKVDVRDASVAVRNKGETPYVIQIFVDDGNGNTRRMPFTVTPPLFRLDGGKEQLVGVRYVKRGAGLPQDVESVYWINVKEIPPTEKRKADVNTLRIAVLTRIKLFYRPAGLAGHAADAPSQLKWSVVASPIGKGVALKVSNPTPYHVTFSTIELHAEQNASINADMVNPRSDLIVPIPSKAVSQLGPVKFSYTTINDYGAVTPATEVTAQPAGSPEASQQ